MVGLGAGAKKELTRVVTCGEFKKTFLKIFEALLAPNYEDRKKPKLSFFDGKSFDKMYQKINDLIGKESGDTTIPEDVHKKLLKILKEYKGKKSPYKLMAVRKVIGSLEEPDPNSTIGKTKYKSRTYGELQKNVSERLEPLYGREEVYANKEESKNEVELWDEIYGCVSKWHDGHPIDNKKYSQIKDCFEGYKNRISKDKKDTFNDIVLQLKNVADRYEEHHECMKNYEKAVEDAENLGEKYNKIKAIELFEKKEKRNPEESAEYKELKKYFDGNFDRVVKGLKRAYFDFSRENGKSALDNILKSFCIYSAYYNAHYEEGSDTNSIKGLCGYLLAGIDVIFCSECFYTKFGNYPPLKITILKNDSVDSIQKVYKDSLNVLKNKCIRENLGEYSVSCISAFIENLKKGKF